VLSIRIGFEKNFHAVRLACGAFYLRGNHLILDLDVADRIEVCLAFCSSFALYQRVTSERVYDWESNMVINS